MAVSKYGTSRCGLCRFYTHEGRRGGRCAQLDVSVESQWKACSLALSPFGERVPSPTYEMAGIATWDTQQALAKVQKAPITSAVTSICS